MGSLTSFFSTAGFLPHGYCILWRPDILALHVVSDVIIAASYFSIPLAIVAFVRQRADLLAEHRRVALLFGAFILGCGLTHVMSVVVLWDPLYAVDGLVKAFTAIMSVITAIALWPMLPRLVEIPSPRVLAQVNAKLEDEIVARRAALDELQAIRVSLVAEVERRTQEVKALARRFEVATEGSAITVSEQDSELRYTWLHNPHPPFAQNAVGRTDAEMLDGAASAVLTALKRQVLENGKAVRASVPLAVNDTEMRYFDMKITPAEVDRRGPGLLVAAVDITAERRQQQQLEVITGELAHRAKNLLSLVDGIARQTAKAEGAPEEFSDRFGARLRALADAHDLLVNQDWRGVDLEELVRAQLAHVLPEAQSRIEIAGPPVTLRPEAAQYLALALHELATNAVKYGILARTNGQLAIRWTPEAETRVRLTWTETGAALTPPERKGFGRLLLEQLAPRALGGEVEMTFDSSGLRWRIDFDAGSPTAGDAR
ncbi:MAG TPA: sensor histidine kinase [Caulobacteraceae bacterium]|jgi:two-component sensor histidine kinase